MQERKVRRRRSERIKRKKKTFLSNQIEEIKEHECVVYFIDAHYFYVLYQSFLSHAFNTNCITPTERRNKPTTTTKNNSIAD